MQKYIIEYKELILKVLFIVICFIGVLFEFRVNSYLDSRIKELEKQEEYLESNLASKNLDLRASDLLGMDRTTVETILGEPYSSHINIDNGGLDVCYLTDSFFKAEGIVRISYSDLYGNIDESNIHGASWNFVMPEAYLDQTELYSDVLSQVIEWYGEPDESGRSDDTETHEWCIWYGDDYNDYEANENLQRQGIARVVLEYFSNASMNNLEIDGYEGYTYIIFSFSDYIGN